MASSQYLLLRVDLSHQSFKIEELPMSLMQQYIGGKGIGTHFLLEEVNPTIDPLSAANKLIFAVGPLTATTFPTSNRIGVLYKSPLTGTYAESYAGGGTAIHMRATGYFTVIVEGRSSIPSYLHITEAGVSFHPAGDLWGKDTIETSKDLLERHGCEGDGSNALCIGPAGENLVRIASIQTSSTRSAGRCGPGAVMGSKNLKAIVFQGKRVPALKETQAYKNLLKKINQSIVAKPELYGKEGLYPRLGTVSIVDWTNELGCFPTRYFTACYSEHKDTFDPPALLAVVKNRRGCRHCPFPCGKHVVISEGPYQCDIEGPEYETVAIFGGVCDIQDIKAIAKINDFCDRVGIDTISAGNLVGLGIEAQRRGRLSVKFPVAYNDPASTLEFLADIAYKRGMGKIFAEGTKAAAQHFHLEDLAMHVKGLEFAGYDPRAFRGFALSYGVSPEGPTHLRSVYHTTEIRLPNRFSYENKVDPLIDWEDRMVFLDSLIVCKFLRAVLEWDTLCEVYNTIFGTHATIADLRALANHVVTLSRVFNVKAGFTRADDYMPDRAYTEVLVHRNGQQMILDRTKYGRMLDEYYNKRGWSSEGVPKGLVGTKK